MLKLLNDLGDTIVEVLIAIALLSFVLGGAYSVANKSSAAVRQAQEHTEALKIAEGQIEQLKQISDNGGEDDNSVTIFDTTTLSDFCIDSNIIYESSPPPAPPPPQCIINNGIDYTIKTGVDNQLLTSKIYTFTVTVEWPSIHGNGNDRVQLSYNLDK